MLAIANAVSIVLSPSLVHGADLGHRGLRDRQRRGADRQRRRASCVLLVRRGARCAPSWPRMRPQFAAARDLGLRIAAFFIAFSLATGVAARMGDAQVAAHQIGFQLWIFMALMLDSVAIAAQALIGRLLGAGRRGRRAAILARRLLVAGLVFGVAVGALFAAGSQRRARALHLGRRRASTRRRCYGRCSSG